MVVINEGERQRRLRHAMWARVNEGWDVAAQEPDRYLLGRLSRDTRSRWATVLALLVVHQPPMRAESGVLSIDLDGVVRFERWWADEERDVGA